MTKTLKNKRILITCGPTWIPIDDTRIISNISTGRLGQIMAKDFQRANAKVHLLEGPVYEPLESKNIKVTKFVYYDEFFQLMRRELKKKYDIIIHAAAVSDYKLKKPFETKISSKFKELKLEFVQTQKIIHQIKKINKNVILVGFKLASKMTEITAKRKTKDLFQKAKCDLVIANSTTSKSYSGYIIDPAHNFLAHETSREAISKALIRILKES